MAIQVTKIEEAIAVVVYTVAAGDLGVLSGGAGASGNFKLAHISAPARPSIVLPILIRVPECVRNRVDAGGAVIP